MENNARLAHLQEAIAAVELAQKTWEATAPRFDTAFLSGMSAVARAVTAAGADDAAALASRFTHDSGLTYRVFEGFTEPVSDLIAATALELRDALYTARGSTRTLSVEHWGVLVPRVEGSRLIAGPRFEYPQGLDEARVREVIRPLVENLDGLLVALDFDGTLAPIQPGESAPDTRADPMANVVLTALSYRARQVVIVTARHPLELIGPDRIQPFPGLVICGNDGLSRWDSIHGIRFPTLGDDDLQRIDHARGLIQPYRGQGLRIEDKEISFEVLVPVEATENLDAAAAILDAIEPGIRAIGQATGLVPVRNSTYWGLRPVGPDKGDTLRTLREEYDADAVLFGGDSTNDGPALRVVQEWQADGFPAVGLLSASAHTSAELREIATLVVPGPPGIIAVNRELARTPLPGGSALRASGERDE